MFCQAARTVVTSEHVDKLQPIVFTAATSQQFYLDFIQHFSTIETRRPASIIHTWIVGLCTLRGALEL